METNFGEFVKARRIAKQITLRAFSEALGMDPSNYSRLERGQLQPPANPEKLVAFARLLTIPLDSEEYREMVRLAALGRGEIPPAILSDEAVLAKLPVLFRTLEGDKVDGAVLDELFESMKNFILHKGEDVDYVNKHEFPWPGSRSSSRCRVSIQNGNVYIESIRSDKPNINFGIYFPETLPHLIAALQEAERELKGVAATAPAQSIPVAKRLGARSS